MGGGLPDLRGVLSGVNKARSYRCYTLGFAVCGATLKASQCLVVRMSSSIRPPLINRTVREWWGGGGWALAPGGPSCLHEALSFDKEPLCSGR